MKNTVKLKNNKDFVTLYKRGKYTSGKFVTVYYKKNGKNYAALGITTGKKVGNAVVRSRCRRIIRAAYSACENDFPIGYDYVIAARPACGNAKSNDIVRFLKSSAIPDVIRSSERRSVNCNNLNKNNK